MGVAVLVQSTTDQFCSYVVGVLHVRHAVWWTFFDVVRQMTT